MRFSTRSFACRIPVRFRGIFRQAPEQWGMTNKSTAKFERFSSQGLRAGAQLDFGGLGRPFLPRERPSLVRDFSTQIRPPKSALIGISWRECPPRRTHYDAGQEFLCWDRSLRTEFRGEESMLVSHRLEGLIKSPFNWCLARMKCRHRVLGRHPLASDTQPTACRADTF